MARLSIFKGSIVVIIMIISQNFFLYGSHSFEDREILSRSYSTSESHVSWGDLPPQKEKEKKEKRVKRERKISREISLRNPSREEKIVKEDKKSEEYLSEIKMEIKKSKSKRYVDLALKIIYSYPLFTSESTLFGFLNTEKRNFPDFVQLFIEQLALTGLPNGLDAFRAAEESFYRLKEGLRVPPLYDLLLQQEMKEPALALTTIPKIVFSQEEKDWFGRWNGDQLVDALTYRDRSLLRLISLGDIKLFLMNQKTAPVSISNLTSHFNRTVNWICFEILKRTQKTERAKVIKFFQLTGRSLFLKNNLHGAMQVAAAFGKISLSRILTDEQTEDLNSEDFIKFLNPLNNYRYYRDLVEVYQENGFLLPAVPIIFTDALHAYEVLSLEALSSIMKLFCRGRSCFHAMNPLSLRTQESLTFVSDLPAVEESTLDEMSNLIKEWDFQRKSILPQNLEEWNATHFYVFLSAHNAQMKLWGLFSKNIYNGKDLIAYIKRSVSLQELTRKFDQIGFTKVIRLDLFSRVQKTLSDFYDVPLLKSSESSLRTSSISAQTTMDTPRQKRHSMVVKEKSTVSVKDKRRRLSLNLGEIKEIVPPKKKGKETDDALCPSITSSSFSIPENLTFWDVYLAVVSNKSGVFEWGRVEGPLLSQIKAIGDHWKSVTPDREHSFNVTLFSLRTFFSPESSGLVEEQFKKKRVCWEYSLPLSTETQKCDGLLRVYFKTIGKVSERTLKESEEMPSEFIKRLSHWQNKEGKQLEEVLGQLESMKPMPYTPHDFSRPRINEISEKSPAAFVKFYYNKEKRELSFSNYPFRPDEFFSILPFIPKNMLILDLRSASIRKADILALAPFLPETLRRLYLSNNRIGDMAGMKLAAHLPPNLEILDLSHNRIGDVALIAISSHFPRTLKEVSLAGNKITSAGVRRLLLVPHLRLAKLDLSYTRIDDLTFSDLSSEPSLPTFLNLSHTNIGDQGILSLMSFEASELQWIDLGETKIRKKGKASLEENGFVVPLQNFKPGIWARKEAL